MRESGNEQNWVAFDSSGGANVGVYRVYITAVDGSDYSGEAYVQYEIVKATLELGTVSVEESLTIYANTLVSTIEANLKSSNENLPAGTWKLNGAGQCIMETGDYSCTFTPTDTHNYTSATGTVHITVTERAVASIGIATPPTKTTYGYGEKFDPAGLVLSVTYNDSTTPEELVWSENSGITFTPEGDLGDVGSKNITISYGGKSITTSVTVTAKVLDLSKVKWNVSTEKYTYDGKEHTGATLTGEIPSELVEKERSGDKGTNAGEYTPSVTFELNSALTASNYILPENLTVTGTQWEIIPGTMTGKNITRNVKYDDTATKEINLSEFGITVTDITAEVGSVTGHENLADTPTITDGTLSYALKEGLSAPTEATSVKIPVTFKAANYTDCTVTLTVNVVSKDVPDITVNDYTKTYNGSAVTMDDLKDRLTVTFEGNPVEGEWTAADTLPTNAGQYTCNLTFSPADKETYQDGLVRVINITINPMEITVKANDAEIVQDGTPVLGYTVTPALAIGDNWTTEPAVNGDTTKYGTVGTHEGAITVSGGVVSSGSNNYTIDRKSVV